MAGSNRRSRRHTVARGHLQPSKEGLDPRLNPTFFMAIEAAGEKRDKWRMGIPRLPVKLAGLRWMGQDPVVQLFARAEAPQDDVEDEEEEAQSLDGSAANC